MGSNVYAADQANLDSLSKIQQRYSQDQGFFCPGIGCNYPSKAFGLAGAACNQARDEMVRMHVGNCCSAPH